MMKKKKSAPPQFAKHSAPPFGKKKAAPPAPARAGSAPPPSSGANMGRLMQAVQGIVPT